MEAKMNREQRMMNHRMKKFIYFLFSLAIVALNSCSDPNEGEMFVTPTTVQSEMSIADVLESNSDYSMWVDFLKYADYYNAFKDASTKATVFCPTNAAVEAFLQKRGVNSVRDLSKTMARSIVQEHVVPAVEVSDSTLNDYAQNASYIPTKNLFESYLTLGYGYTITDVDDAQRTSEVHDTASVYINNQAKLASFTGIACANGHIFSMSSVIEPLAETILGKLELDDDYSIFAAAIRESGYDSIANKVKDTTYVQGGGYVVNTYNYTCFAVPNSVFKANGVTDVSSLKSWLVTNSNGEETNGETALSHYVKYHFLLRKYGTDELFNFQSAGESLIYETKYEGQAMVASAPLDVRTLNNTIHILRSDMAARNGLIDKIDGMMPVYHPSPVTVKWDFLNTADIISFVNAYGASRNLGDVFTSPLTSTDSKRDLSTDRRDGDYGTLSSFTYANTASKASASNYRVVGFYKEKYASSSAKTTSKYGTYMNNYLCLNLGYAGWIQFKTPAIIAGKYKVVLHYCSDVTLKSFYTSGSLTKYNMDNESSSVYLYKGLGSVLTGTKMLGAVVDITLFPSIEFTGSGTHTFKVTMMDINAKTSALYHQMYDYLEFIPIQ